MNLIFERMEERRGNSVILRYKGALFRLFKNQVLIDNKV